MKKLKLPVCPYCKETMELDRVKETDVKIFTYWFCACDDDELYKHNSEIESAKYPDKED